jgi:SAM-dependent methyltransferase
MSLLLEVMVDRCPEHTIVLDVAPTEGFAATLRRLSGSRYLSIDFDPTADGRVVDAHASITDLPTRDGSVGFLLCSHVLEHVPDDAKAMAEIGRVLSPEGVALIQVPRRPDSPTDEDPSAPVEDRIRRFGQADHVRYYGYDFEDRLRAAGLRVSTFRYSWVLPGRALKMVGAANDEEVWVATTGVDPLEFLDGDAVFDSFGRALVNAEASQAMGADRLHELETRVEMAEAEAAEWKSHYEWLRSRPFVMFGTRASHALKRLVPRR